MLDVGSLPLLNPMSSSLNHSNPQPVLFELPLARRRNLQYSIDPVKGGLRKLHIRRLFDLLHLSLLRQDLSRAHKIWRILIRSREVDFAQLWHLGLRLLLPSSTDLTGDEDERLSGLETSLSYLKACQNLDLKEVRTSCLLVFCSYCTSYSPTSVSSLKTVRHRFV